MKSGRKPESLAIKKLRGTYRPDRDGWKTDGAEIGRPPQKPDWLTEAGAVVWLDYVDIVVRLGTATSDDSAMFADWCNLQGAIGMAWQSGGVPPVTALAECRRMRESLGLAGPRSRLDAPAPAEANPFVDL